MEREQLRQTLLDILEQETWERPEHFTDDTQLREELKLDSVDMVSVLLRLESQLGVGLDSRELEKVVTVGHLLDILHAKLATTEERKAA